MEDCRILRRRVLVGGKVDCWAKTQSTAVEEEEVTAAVPVDRIFMVEVAVADLGMVAVRSPAPEVPAFLVVPVVRAERMERRPHLAVYLAAEAALAIPVQAVPVARANALR